jgi:hypothetical protein
MTANSAEMPFIFKVHNPSHVVKECTFYSWMGVNCRNLLRSEEMGNDSRVEVWLGKKIDLDIAVTARIFMHPSAGRICRIV